jgi:hypothetical protein
MTSAVVLPTGPKGSVFVAPRPETIPSANSCDRARPKSHQRERCSRASSSQAHCAHAASMTATLL